MKHISYLIGFISILAYSAGVLLAIEWVVAQFMPLPSLANAGPMLVTWPLWVFAVLFILFCVGASAVSALVKSNVDDAVIMTFTLVCTAILILAPLEWLWRPVFLK